MQWSFMCKVLQCLLKGAEQKDLQDTPDHTHACRCASLLVVLNRTNESNNGWFLSYFFESIRKGLFATYTYQSKVVMIDNGNCSFGNFWPQIIQTFSQRCNGKELIAMKNYSNFKLQERI